MTISNSIIMDNKTEHDIVVANIRDVLSVNYKVLTNLGVEQNHIGQMYPDAIIFDKVTDRPIFIIEVRKNGTIAPCIQQWKSAQTIPAILYIIVPETDLPTAKSVAQVVGLKLRFGSYKIDSDNKATVNYE